jgi:hypothetical protein
MLSLHQSQSLLFRPASLQCSGGCLHLPSRCGRQRLGIDDGDVRFRHLLCTHPSRVDRAAQARRHVNRQNVGVGGRQLPVGPGKVSRRGLRRDGKAVGRCQQAIELAWFDIHAFAVGFALKGNDERHDVNIQLGYLPRGQA